LVVAANGGKFGKGVVFEFSAAGAFSVLHAFSGSDGANPQAGLIIGRNGNLFGTAAKGGKSGKGVVFEVSKAGVETVLRSFAGSDGANPAARLLADGAGNLFGTTQHGGLANCAVGFGGCGVAFKLAPNGSLTVLHAFNGGDGFQPQAGLISDKNGNLFGSSFNGGLFGQGVPFELALDGTETVLHNFSGAGDEEGPSELIADKQGNLFFTTDLGGGCIDFQFGCGEILKFTLGGKETVLHVFAGPSFDGEDPLVGLFADNKGNLFGTTQFGGSSSACPAGCGTVFELTGTGFAK